MQAIKATTLHSANVNTCIVFKKDCIVCADSEVFANIARLASLEQIAEEVGGLSKTINGFSQSLNGISNKIDRMQAAKSIKYALLPSSKHSKDFNETVVNYYGGKRKCCVSGKEDPGNQNLAMEERVTAAHLISSKNRDAYLELNKGKGKREFLTEFSPRSCVLMQRKWEILFDCFAWCFVPADPMSDAPIYNICVLVDTQKQDGSFEYWKKLIPESRRFSPSAGQLHCNLVRISGIWEIDYLYQGLLPFVSCSLKTLA